MSDKYADLKKRIWFVVFALIVFRIGAYIPVPGLNLKVLAAFFNQESQSSGFLGMMNMFNGGALARFSIFALGVMPYISASIVMQLLTTVVPSLEALNKEGESGRRKINQYTRYATIALSFFQAIGISKMLAMQSGVVIHPDFSFFFIASITLVAGTMFLMWLGEQITDKGIGNGVSMIIFAGIVDRVPSAIEQTFNILTSKGGSQLSPIVIILIVLLIAVVVAFVFFMESGRRKITVQYAKRQVGNKIYAGQASHIPLKVNMSGVIAAIFATSIILFPASISGWLGNAALAKFAAYMQAGTWGYAVTFSAAVIFFSFFYTALTFNPKEMADNLRKSGAFIPGIRPGDKTAEYIDKVATRLTLPGSLYVAAICLLPQVLIQRAHVPFYFGGTSLLIVTGVVMDITSQVQTHILTGQYEGLVKKNTKRRGKFYESQSIS